MLERNPSPGEEEDGAHDGEGESEATKLAQGGSDSLVDQVTRSGHVVRKSIWANPPPKKNK